MFCTKCGYELNNMDEYCPKCGEKVRLKDDSIKVRDNRKIENVNQAVNDKVGRIKLIVFILIFVALIIIIVLFALSFYRRRIRNSGHFVKINGIDTYVENGEVITNTLVNVRGKKIYFVDENGHKKKNSWEIIDNDGTYGYFGSMGELVKNKIREINGKKYYFDSNGKLVTNNEVEIDGIKYTANADGEIYTLEEYKEAETKIIETVLAKITPTTQQIVIPSSINQSHVVPEENTVKIIETTAQTSQKYIVIDKETVEETIVKKETVVKTSPLDDNPVIQVGNVGPGVGIVDNYKKSYVDDKLDENTEDDDIEYEVKIKSTEKITDTIEDDDYECKLTFVKPIMQGKNQEETDILNETIDELMDVLYDEIESLINDYSSLPKSVTFSNPSLSTVNKTNIIINLTGSISPRSGSSKSIKYRITYKRDEENGDIVKIS